MRCQAFALLLGLLLAHGAAGRRLAGDKAAANVDTTLPAAALDTNGSLSSNLPDADGTVEMKIINGDDAVAGQFDFMVALFMNGRFFCGGVLLDNSTVLTAAHCVVDTKIVDNPSALTVWAMGNQYPVDRIFAHPGYSASKIPQDNADMTFDGSLHDVALIKLKNPIPDLTSVALLPAKDLQLSDQQRLQVAGWGTTETGRPSNVLQFAGVEYLLPYRCPSDYDDVLCGGGTGQNTCNGDSGGPLIVRNGEGKAVVVGVTSHGPDCQSQPNNPNYAYGFYTDVPVLEPSAAMPDSCGGGAVAPAAS
ncbi:hypothetical protein COHA_008679 [Chlorella ohadii]|uniref:Peptidase S1 domain-containing protein n=1 Tax=Chlorella ohadii TaxID=2649997 RepID=A0AAD5DJP4_9CHLO|nr:hypothetical protein COHA_008679 [Chlorella ohadii]